MLKADLEIENKHLLEENARMRRTLSKRTVSTQTFNKAVQAGEASLELMRQSRDAYKAELDKVRLLNAGLLADLHDIGDTCACGAYDAILQAGGAAVDDSPAADT